MGVKMPELTKKYKELRWKLLEEKIKSGKCYDAKVKAQERKKWNDEHDTRKRVK